MFTLDSKANSRITDDTDLCSQRFVFPVDVGPTLRFRDLNEIRDHLRKEEQHCEDITIRNLFNGYCKPNQQDCKYIRMRCRCCPAHLNYKKQNDMFVLSMWNNIHEHQTKLSSSKIDASIFQVFREKTKLKFNLNRLKEPILKQYAISKTHFETLLRRFDEEELTNFSHLQRITSDAEMEIQYDWGSNLKERYPRLMVTVTPAMKRNYLKYGELLTFDFTDNAIRNVTTDFKRYKLAVFCVIDTNMRILLVGLVLMCERNSQQIKLAFEMFFKLHCGAPYPMTVQTSPDKDVCESIIAIQSEKYMRAIHIYDPHYIVDNIQRNLKGDPEKNKLVVKAIVRMIRVRTEREFAECIQEIKENCEDLETLRPWLQEEAISRYAYFLIPSTFLGIRRFFNERSKTLVEEQIAYETSINAIIERMIGLDKRLDAKSADGYRIYTESIEYQLMDPRVKCARLVFQSKAFERFLQNYFKCLAEARLVDDPSNFPSNDRMFQVRSNVTGQIFKVDNWICECDEFIKTGIPCMHVLECARRIKQMSYVPLFNKRWLKELPNRGAPKIMWIKRGRAKSSRRNTHKKRIGAGGTGTLM